MISGYTIVPLIALILYLGSIYFIARRARTQHKGLLILYLGVSAALCLISFVANSAPQAELPTQWARMLPLLTAWTIVSYVHYTAAYINRRPLLISRIGYAYLFAAVLPVALNWIPQSLTITDGAPTYSDYGIWTYAINICNAALLGTAVIYIIQSYLRTNNPEHRNHTAYLICCLRIIIITDILASIVQVEGMELGVLGYLCNAIIITWAAYRVRVPDLKTVFHRGVVYTGVAVLITALYLVLLNTLSYFLPMWPAVVGITATAVMVVLVAYAYNTLRRFVQRLTDRIFYGKRYEHRQAIFNFANRMSNVMDLKDISEATLHPITHAVKARQASLLFTVDEHYSVQYAERFVDSEPFVAFNLHRDGAIIEYLTVNTQPLSRETIDLEPEFKSLRHEDIEALDSAQVELLCGIKSKSRLIGILALSKKHGAGAYCGDDSNLLMTLVQEAAITIENAQMYTSAKQRANTDELTGLFNHRYFHERLDEEIARCSRFGDIFSLVFMDLDLFKTYNDVYGHLAGDDILEQAAKQIKKAARDTDIGFRYGGDEFALILPRTPVEGAEIVADRIRRAIESQMEWKGVPLTISIGLASWPTDGVMREEIIQAADAALYYAKQSGRNKICMAGDVTLSEVLRMDNGSKPQSKEAIISTIYALAATVDAKDNHTYGHSKKVCQYACEIAEAMGYAREAVANIRAAALLHDIGKIGIADRLLSKRETLTHEDWETICAHPDLGMAILKHVDTLKSCLPGVQYHHERFDGTGYPAGLKGNNIPLDARILAVADAYDAMTSHRPYRIGSLSQEQAFVELQRCAGTHFDPTIVNIFVRLHRLSIQVNEAAEMLKE